MRRSSTEISEAVMPFKTRIQLGIACASDLCEFGLVRSILSEAGVCDFRPVRRQLLLRRSNYFNNTMSLQARFLVVTVLVLAVQCDAARLMDYPNAKNSKVGQYMPESSRQLRRCVVCRSHPAALLACALLRLAACQPGANQGSSIS